MDIDFGLFGRFHAPADGDRYNFIQLLPRSLFAADQSPGNFAMTIDGRSCTSTFNCDGRCGRVSRVLRSGARATLLAAALLAASSAASQALTFNLNVSFGPQIGGPGPSLGGGTLTGTYNVPLNPFPLLPNQQLFLSSYSFTLSIPSAGISDPIALLPPPNGSTIEIQNLSGFDQFSFEELAPSGDAITIQLLFPTSYAGTGDPVLPDAGTFSKNIGGSEDLLDGLVILLPGAIGGGDIQHSLPVTGAAGQPVDTPPTSVSEPPSLMLIAGGLALFGALQQRRRTRSRLA